jgi:acetone carboxylase gamma subunit
MSYPKEVIRDLIYGKLPWEQAKGIISGFKDEDRFDKYIEILQDKVPWKERILLPLAEHLYIVEKGEGRIVKCDCGYEFGDYRENWKLKALINTIETEEEMDELYPGFAKPDVHYCEIRQFYCPGCGSQLEVETVPKGFPIIFDFLPDIDTFYREWLQSPLSTEKEYQDLTYALIKKWDSPSYR